MNFILKTELLVGEDEDRDSDDELEKFCVVKVIVFLLLGPVIVDEFERVDPDRMDLLAVQFVSSFENVFQISFCVMLRKSNRIFRTHFKDMHQTMFIFIQSLIQSFIRTYFGSLTQITTLPMWLLKKQSENYQQA